MDPNTLLKEIREMLVCEQSHQTFNVVGTWPDQKELGEKMRNLDEWLSRGGFLPKAWEKKEK